MEQRDGDRDAHLSGDHAQATPPEHPQMLQVSVMDHVPVFYCKRSFDVTNLSPGFGAVHPYHLRLWTFSGL